MAHHSSTAWEKVMTLEPLVTEVRLLLVYQFLGTHRPPQCSDQLLSRKQRWALVVLECAHQGLVASCDFHLANGIDTEQIDQLEQDLYLYLHVRSQVVESVLWA
jgi:hypothetical protein